MDAKIKKISWVGIIFICVGLVFLAPLTYHDFSKGSVVGPFFGVCIGLTFLSMGFVRIQKTRQSGVSQGKSLQADITTINTSSLFDFSSKKAEKPRETKVPKKGVPSFAKFILCVALLPVLPLVTGLSAGVVCDLLLGLDSLGSCIGHSWAETLAYLGVLGWFVSLPIALLLSLIYAASEL
jgi:hypothetical protein